MWPKTFSERLESWAKLRHQCQKLSPEHALLQINLWWFQTPWIPYHLHWDDQLTWPDPWQLLEDNLYCSLARGLGILYTIAIVDRADLQNSVLTETDQGNLVLTQDQKYILNWDSEQVLNINPGQITARHSVTQQQIKQQIN